MHFTFWSTIKNYNPNNCDLIFVYLKQGYSTAVASGPNKNITAMTATENIYRVPAKNKNYNVYFQVIYKSHICPLSTNKYLVERVRFHLFISSTALLN